MVEGHAERPETDSFGQYSFGLLSGTLHIKAGRAGYIQEHTELEVNGEATQLPTFTLYPKPEKDGFYVVGSADYQELSPQRVYTVGNELKSFFGTKGIGEVALDSKDVKLMFHTDLRVDEILRLGLELHRLNFVHKAALPGSITSGEVEINLWTGAKQIPVEFKPMHSRTDYLLEVKASLEPGHYAFHTQNLLNPETLEAWTSIPEGLRNIYPFEVR